MLESVGYLVVLALALMFLFAIVIGTTWMLLVSYRELKKIYKSIKEFE